MVGENKSLSRNSDTERTSKRINPLKQKVIELQKTVQNLNYSRNVTEEILDKKENKCTLCGLDFNSKIC